MEMHFDIASFVLGGGAAILGLHLAQLSGYVAGLAYARMFDAGEPTGTILSDELAMARGQMLSGS